MRLLLLMLPVIAVVFVSGCTIPGIGNLFGPQVISYENDVVVITEMRAVPDKVSPDQAIRLIAYVQNVGDKEISTSADPAFGIKGQVAVTLYDYCPGLLSVIEAETVCAGQTGSPAVSSGGTVCTIDKLLPKEIKEIRWVLQPEANTKITSTCLLKVAASYPYKTFGLTTINFIHPEEYQRRLEQDSFEATQSQITKGPGPIKAYIQVEDQQPIPISSPGAAKGKTLVTLHIENEGSGFLSWKNPSTQPASTTSSAITTPAILPDDLTVTFPSIGNNDLKGVTGECRFETGKPDDEIHLIRDEAAPLICKIELPEAPAGLVETTSNFLVELDYEYEFRDHASVTVETVD